MRLALTIYDADYILRESMQESFSPVITYTRSISTFRESQGKVALVYTANRLQFTSRPGIAQCTNALRVAGCDYPKFTS